MLTTVNMVSMVIAGLFLVSLGVLFAAGHIRLSVLIAYCVLSLITYGLYAWDKKAAQKGSWRISENNLHLIALLGGWPGALCAQQHLRHKSKKVSFRLMLWITVLINNTLLVAFLGFF